MKGCKDIHDELALFVDGSLEADGAARVAAHVAGCAACAAEVGEIRALLGAMARAGDPAASAERGERHWQTLARDIRAATDALPMPRLPWWRRPLALGLASGLAVAAAVAGALLVVRPVAVAPVIQEVADIADVVDDEQLALGSPAAADEELEELELDDAAAARVEAAL